MSLIAYIESQGLVNASDLMALGAIYLNGKRVVRDVSVGIGDLIKIYISPRRFEPPKHPESLILFEDSSILAIDKPCGLPSHPYSDNKLENALAFFSQLTQQKLYPMHRLDQPTSGVLCFAKSANVQHQFQKDRESIRKIYTALVSEPVSLGNHTHWIKKQENLFISSSEASENAKLAQLEILSCESTHLKHYRLLLRLVTGRTHQIRSQLKALGAPILGDSIYGIASAPRLCLHALSLQWRDYFIQSEVPEFF